MEEQNPESQDLDLNLSDELDVTTETATEPESEVSSEDTNVSDNPVTDSVYETPATVQEIEEPPLVDEVTDNEVEEQAVVALQNPAKVPYLDIAIMKMPVKRIVKDQDLTERLAAELSQQANALAKNLSIINTELKRLSGLQDQVSRYQSLHEKRNPKKGVDMQHHLAVIHKTRMDKALAARAFLGGLPAKDVMREINPKSKLDQVMGARRAGIGDGRKPAPLLRK